jgi:hypothetical protein
MLQIFSTAQSRVRFSKYKLVRSVVAVSSVCVLGIVGALLLRMVRTHLEPGGVELHPTTMVDSREIMIVVEARTPSPLKGSPVDMAGLCEGDQLPFFIRYR